MNARNRILRATAFAVALLATCGVQSPFAATLFALVDTGELFFSVDGGMSWDVRATLPVDDAVAIAATDVSNELVLVTRSGSVYGSADAGVSWTGVGTITADDIAGMAIEPDGDILALSRSGSVWKSIDGGASFTGIATIDIADDCTAIAVDGPSGDVFTLGETGAVSRSTTGGASFFAAGVITTPDASALLVRSGALFALTATGAIARSDDDGASWVFVGTFSQVTATALTTDGSGIVAATAEGLVATSADATAWTFVGSVNQIHVVALGNDIPTVTAVAPHPRAEFAMKPVFRNPGRRGAAVTLELTLAAPEAVSLEFYAVDGRLVARRAAERFGAGAQFLEWTPPRSAAGVYFLRARTASGRVAQTRLVLVE